MTLVPKTLELVGFVADLVGNERHFIAAEAVLKIGDQTYVTPGTSEWTVEDLRPVGQDDESFIYWIKPAQVVPIQEGQSVWLSGPQFVSSLALASPLKLGDFRSQFLSWPEFRGFRWAIGSDAEFRALNLRLARSLEQLIHQSLFDDQASSFGSAELIFNIFSVLDVAKRPDFELTKALYFDERRDEYSKTFTIENAIVEGIFRNRLIFDVKLRRLRSRLRRERLRDTTRRQSRSSMLRTSWLNGDASIPGALAAVAFQHRKQASKAGHGALSPVVIRAAKDHPVILHVEIDSKIKFLDTRSISFNNEKFLIQDVNRIAPYRKLVSNREELLHKALNNER